MGLKLRVGLAVGGSMMAFCGVPAQADGTPECNVGGAAFSTECGAPTSAQAEGGTAVGSYAEVTADGVLGTAVGALTEVSQREGTALGYAARANGQLGSIMVTPVANEIGGTAVGSYSRTQGNESVAIGGFAVVGERGGFATVDSGTAIGAGTNVVADGGTALGARATVTGNNSVAIGALSEANENDTVSFGAVGSERRLTNVAAGTADTDGVNFAQLQGVATQAAAAQATADSAAIAATAAQGTADTAIAAATVAGATADTALARAVSLGQVAAAALGGGATFDPATGTVSAPNYDVRGASFADVGSALGALDDGLSQLEGRFDLLDMNNELVNRRASGGIAAAMALGGTMVVPDSDISVSLNAATYRGEQGFSGSIVARVAPRIYMNGGIAGSTVKGSTGGRVGMAFGF